ncbi:suppressor of SWI4 1 homolog isoform X1 [Branchiostoma floridae x Branchiostoma japonicum]
MARKKSGKRKGKAAKQAKQNAEYEREDLKKAPHTFVIARGKVGNNVGQLVKDMRRVMEPFTASNLKVRKKNVLKDFVAVAGPLGVTHLVIFTKTDKGVNMKFSRLPRGPTLSFKVDSYALCKDVLSTLKRQQTYASQFQHSPLLVLNNLAREGMHFKLMSTMFQNMFPSINIHRLKLNTIKRCVLFTYDPDTNMVDFRHYNIKVVPIGMSRGVKKLLQSKVPNLKKYEDVSEYILGGGNLSESEAEPDGDQNEVDLPQQVAGRGNEASQKSAIRLTEIGPRLRLQLVKIEEGLCGGDVIFHQFVTKSAKEIEELKERREEKKMIKAQRKAEQDANIKKKEQLKEENKQRSLAGIKRKQKDNTAVNEENPEDSSDDDTKYYRQEVGEEPDADLMLSRTSKRKPGRPDSSEKRKRPRSESRPQGAHGNRNFKKPRREGPGKPGFKGQKGGFKRKQFDEGKAPGDQKKFGPKGKVYRVKGTKGPMKGKRSR